MPAVSSAAAARKSMPSANGRATSWMPTGRPCSRDEILGQREVREEGGRREQPGEVACDRFVAGGIDHQADGRRQRRDVDGCDLVWRHEAPRRAAT
jgi:hypothetical protein